MKIAALARRARESLGRGLEALQDGKAPKRLLAVAQPLAKAMGTLVEMEMAPPELARKAADSVLAALREGLGLLQLPQNVQLPAAAAALASVAEALGHVHEITESSRGAARGPKGKTKLAAPQLASASEAKPASPDRAASPLTAPAAAIVKPAAPVPTNPGFPAATATRAAPVPTKPGFAAAKPRIRS